MCVCMQSSSAASMDAVLEVLSKQPGERTAEDVGKSFSFLPIAAWICMCICMCGTALSCAYVLCELDIAIVLS